MAGMFPDGMPKGVAALPRPIALAERFRIMAPMAGCRAGTSGNSRTMRGRMSEARIRSNPPASATFIRPKNNVMTPIKLKASSTEPAADSIIALVRLSMGETWPPIHWISRHPAVTKETKTIPRNTAFIFPSLGHRSSPLDTS